MTKLRIAALIAAVSCIGVFVAGCGDSSSSTPDATTPATKGADTTKGADATKGADTKMGGAPAGNSTTTPPGPGAAKTK